MRGKVKSWNGVLVGGPGPRAEHEELDAECQIFVGSLALFHYTACSCFQMMQLFLFMHVHGAAHRRTKKYPNGPMQVGVVSRLARAAARLRVCANREFGTSFTRDELFSSRSRDPSPECVRSPWGRTPQNPKVPKWSYTNRRGFPPRLRVGTGRTVHQQSFQAEVFSCSARRALAIPRQSAHAGVRTEPVGPHTAEPESTQMVLYKSAWFLPPRARLGRTDCEPTKVSSLSLVG